MIDEILKKIRGKIVRLRRKFNKCSYPLDLEEMDCLDSEIKGLEQAIVIIEKVRDR